MVGYPRFHRSDWVSFLLLGIWMGGNLGTIAPIYAVPSTRALARSFDQTVECEILVVGGGLAGVATSYEALLAGRTVCMTDITDWMGGQITAQGTSALDEVKKQRALLFYAHGYNELRQRIKHRYGELNPGDCWVSYACFIPRDAQTLLVEELRDAAKKGKGKLKWFPNTVIKDLERSADGRLIQAAIAIQHHAAPGASPLNTASLSQTIEDAYQYADSDRFTKKILRFIPLDQPQDKQRRANLATANAPDWIVVDATETGELIALADVPYRLGLDPRSYLNPSSPTVTGDPYCTQGFTYPFAMERTATPQPQTPPPFYAEYEPYYGYDPNPNLANIDVVFSYRRIWSPKPRSTAQVPIFGRSLPKPGDISMQNWVWGNDYRPGTAQDNLILTREQLQQAGQLASGGWMGGLRTDTLRKGEENALGYYYWFVAGTTDSQLGSGIKQPAPNHRLLRGLDSPMGTMHGLSKYPYIRESRRIMGRPTYSAPQGFSLSEIDISWTDYRSAYYQNLPPKLYQDLWFALAGLEATSAIRQNQRPEQITRRTRSTIYPDSVGIAQYAIDFHPCMAQSPPERPGNQEYPGVRQAHGQAFPGQIPLRAMIPQTIDNLLIASKGVAASYSVTAAYRVHSFEWSVGAAAGTTASFVLSEGILPYQLVDNLPQPEPQLQALQQRLVNNGNPIAFPDTSIFNLDWNAWRPW